MNTNYLRLNIYQAGIRVFDRDRQPALPTHVVKGTLVKLMFWVKGIRQYSEGWKLDLVVLQARIYDPIPTNRCLIIDDEPTANVNTSAIATSVLPSSGKSDDAFQKYRDLISKGVPRMAVEQKCRLAGLDPAGIDGTSASLVKPGISLGDSLTQAISGGVRLKKCTQNPKHKPKPKPKPKTNQLIPTLDDILTQLNSLRRTRS